MGGREETFLDSAHVHSKLTAMKVVDQYTSSDSRVRWKANYIAKRVFNKVAASHRGVDSNDADTRAETILLYFEYQTAPFATSRWFRFLAC